MSIVKINTPADLLHLEQLILDIPLEQILSFKGFKIDKDKSEFFNEHSAKVFFIKNKKIKLVLYYDPQESL